MFGNEFRVRETAVSRHWAMMGFDTLKPGDRGFPGGRPPGRRGRRLCSGSEVQPGKIQFVTGLTSSPFSSDKITTRFRSQVLIEEQRSNYRRLIA